MTIAKLVSVTYTGKGLTLHDLGPFEKEPRATNSTASYEAGKKKSKHVYLNVEYLGNKHLDL